MFDEEMDSGLIVGVVVIIVLAAAGFWYFTQNNQPVSAPVSNSSAVSANTSSSIPPATQNVTVSYNDSDALNDLASAITPMAGVLSGLGFLNDSNASVVLNGVVYNLSAFESSGNLSSLSDRGFFISYAGAVVELAAANQDYLNALMIQNNQTVSNDLCANKQTYLRSLFFANKSIQEVLNASAMLNSTLDYPDLSSGLAVNYSVSYLDIFAGELQNLELKQESNIYSICG